MTATVYLIGALALIVAGVALLAHSDPADPWLAVAGWGCMVAAFVTLAAALPEDDR